MAGLNEELSLAHDNSFALTILRLPLVSFNCSTISIPGVTSADTTVELPTLNYDSPNGKLTYDPFTCRFLVSEDYSNWISIFTWMLSYQSATGPESVKSDFSVIIPNNHGKDNISVNFINGYPESFDAIDLSASVSEPSPILCGLTMKYQSFNITTTISS